VHDPIRSTDVFRFLVPFHLAFFVRLAVLAFLLWLGPGTAHAEGGAAEALFRAGRAALSAGDIEGARRRFEESERLEPAPGTQLNLALCDEKLGRLAQAWQRFQQVVHALPPDDERASMALTHARALEPKLAWIRFSAVARFPASARVVSGSTHLTSASFGVALPFDPGAHSFEVRAPGRASRRYDVRLQAGERRRLELAAGVPLELGRAESPPQRPLLSTLGIASAGASAAGLLASAGFGILALDAKNTMARECDGSGCSDAGVRAAARGQTFATVSTTAFFGSLVLGAVSAALFWGSSGSETESGGQHPRTKHTSASAVRLERRVTP
jgi:hypothetical protein